jgi:hypothetical protein
MTIVKVNDINTKNTYEYFIEPRLKNQLDKKVIPTLTKNDEDYIFVIDGEERSGKSVLGMQIGKYIDNSLSLDRICFTPDEFRKAIINAEKGQCIIFDEAYRGLSAKGALTEMNRLLVSLMMEMGQKNLCVIIILPTFYLIEKYVAIWRARGLFHVFRNRNGQKGYFVFFNKKKKKQLYLKGKKDYSYRYVKSRFKGRFYGKYVIDEQEYRKKKAKSLKEGYKQTRQEKYMEQRNILLYILNKEFNLSSLRIQELCKIYQLPLKKSQIIDILSKMRRRP